MQLISGVAFLILGVAGLLIFVGAPSKRHETLAWLAAAGLVKGVALMCDSWLSSVPAPPVGPAWIATPWILAPGLLLLEFSRRLSVMHLDAGRRRMPALWLYCGLVLVLLSARGLGASPSMLISTFWLLVSLMACLLVSTALWQSGPDQSQIAVDIAAVVIALGCHEALTGLRYDAGANLWWSPDIIHFSSISGVSGQVAQTILSVAACATFLRWAAKHDQPPGDPVLPTRQRCLQTGHRMSRGISS